MASYDFAAPRLYLDAPLAGELDIALGQEHGNYLKNVLRLGPGDAVLVFNGRDGEWRATLSEAGRKKVSLRLAEQVRAQTARGDLWYLFAPLKHARLDYMVQKAVELGATRLAPVLTRRTQVARVNLDRMRANSIEAAEQCGILDLPEIVEPVALDRTLADWPDDRAIVFCDEDAGLADPIAALSTLAHTKIAVLIGPEGGFDPAERASLARMSNVVRLSLGPRVLRADTAAVAALALVQAIRGDWRGT